jgi:hypothetical protein
MGSGCTSQNSATSSDRIRQFRQGNLTFYIHGILQLENKTAGKGCRRTVAWHTNLPKNEIDLKIQEFWETRIDGSPAVWAILKQACTLPDSPSTESLLKNNNISMPNGLLQQCFDSRNHRYDLPPFVVNPPISYGKGEPGALVSSFTKEKIELTVRSTKFNDFTVEVFSTDKVEDLKGKINKNIQNDRFRTFYAGRELKDGASLGSYGLKNGFIVQVFLL